MIPERLVVSFRRMVSSLVIAIFCGMLLAGNCVIRTQQSHSCVFECVKVRAKMRQSALKCVPKCAMRRLVFQQHG